MNDSPSSPHRHIAALYHFARIAEESLALKQSALKDLCARHGIKGSLLLAPEGINGTIEAKSREALDAVLDHIAGWDEIGTPAAAASEASASRHYPIEVKYATADKEGFRRMKVRLKREIVTMHKTDLDPANMAGEYVTPVDWNALIARDDVLVVDVRNSYETRLGMFRGATDPATDTFGAFPAWADGLAEKEGAPEKIAQKKIAMYCTGGIRCEKASAYMKSIGFGEVYHLKGGILKYLEEIPESESLWQGACFVFDDRVSVGHGLTPGDHTLCGGCKAPLDAADRAHPAYEAGVACRHCAGKTTQAQRARFRERQKQITLAQARGEKHMGEAHEVNRRRQDAKRVREPQ